MTDLGTIPEKYNCAPENSTRNCYKISSPPSRCYYHFNSSKYDYCVGGVWNPVILPIGIELDVKCEVDTDQVYCKILEYDFAQMNKFGIYGKQYCYNHSTAKECSNVKGCQTLDNGVVGNVHFFKIKC